VRAFYHTALNDRDADAAVPNVGTSWRQLAANSNTMF
jgi:hypothetical protein